MESGRRETKGERLVGVASRGAHSFPPAGLYHKPHPEASPGWRWGEGASRRS